MSLRCVTRVLKMAVTTGKKWGGAIFILSHKLISSQVDNENWYGISYKEVLEKRSITMSRRAKKKKTQEFLLLESLEY